jgi:hypothetical protein
LSARLPTTVARTGVTSRVRAVVLENTGVELVDKALARIVDALRPVFANPRLDQTVVKDVAFSAGVNTPIGHRLGRAYSGWNVVRVRDAASAFVEVTQNPVELDLVQVTLNSVAMCTADVEVW